MNDLDMIIREAVTHSRRFEVNIIRNKEGREIEAYVTGPANGPFDPPRWHAGFDYIPSRDGCWRLTNCRVKGQCVDCAALLRAIEGAA